MAIWVKLCGFTREADLEAALLAGCDAVGLNLVPASPRALSRERVEALGILARGEAEVVAVVDAATQDLASLQELWGRGLFDRVQLHGMPRPELIEACSPWAFAALRIGDARDVENAVTVPGAPLLVDARVEGALGGTGQRLDGALVADLARQRPLVLAGGLEPDNVAGAIRQVAPWGVDAASGVELPGQPGVKVPELMRRFVAEARCAAEL